MSLLRKAMPPTMRVLDAARKAGILVIHTREGHRPDLADLPPAKKARGRLATGIGDPGPMGRILVRGEHGHDIIDELKPAPGEPVVDKPGKGAFYATDLDAILKSRGVRQLIVCGVTTEVCVNTTVREANDRGYDCLVLDDCVASYFPEFQRSALEMVKAQGGIFGWVGAPPTSCRRCNRRRRRPEEHRRSDADGSQDCSRKRKGGTLMTMQREADNPIRWWVPGDWNGFFGLFTNVVLNVIVLTGLCLGVVKLPADIVFGRILPALGIALPIGNLYYAYLAYRLARTENRSDVTAMPYGPSVPHMFIVVFVIMLPVYLKTNDAMHGLAGRSRLGVHHRRHRPDRRLHRPDDPATDAARGDARHARRHLDRLHLACGPPSRCGRCRGSRSSRSASC